MKVSISKPLKRFERVILCLLYIIIKLGLVFSISLFKFLVTYFYYIFQKYWSGTDCIYIQMIVHHKWFEKLWSRTLSLAHETYNKIGEIWKATINTQQNVVETIEEIKNFEGSVEWKGNRRTEAFMEHLYNGIHS